MSDASPVVAVTYAERWSKRKGEVVRPLAEEDARERHERGELYTVLVGDPGRPRAYLEVRLEAGFVGVHFLDDELRNHLTYLFTRPPEEQGDLFLEQISRRGYGVPLERVRGPRSTRSRDQPRQPTRRSGCPGGPRQPE